MTPDDERARIKERQRGVLARQMFDNPLWDESYTTLVNDQIARLLSEATDDEETIKCKRRILALYDVKRHMQTILETGRMADMQLQEAKEKTNV